jgi:cytochrome c556
MSETENQGFETVNDIAERPRNGQGDFARLGDLAALPCRRRRQIRFYLNMFGSFVCLSVIAASLLTVPHTWAANEYEDVLAYKYRGGVMQAIGGHMDAVTVIMRGKMHEDELALHTESIVDLAKLVPTIFPAGSDVAKSEALSAIWEEPDRFSEAVERFIDASGTLHQAVQSQTGVRNAFAALGKTCKSCHDSFRE